MRASFIVHTLPLHAGLVLALPGIAARATDIGYFNPPQLEPFLQMDLRVDFVTNVTTPDGVIGLAPNREGGSATGAFEAEILPVGAAFERAVLNEEGENSFLQNRYIFQTPENETISLEVDAIIHYENNALHGFGFGKFATTVPRLMAINYKSFVVEVEGSFNTGEARAEVFEIKPCGRRDGKPIEALLPPGGA